MKKLSFLLKEVKKIVCQHDPMGLIAAGAPEDEYDAEIMQIARLLPLDADKLADAIRNIFAKSFDKLMAGKKDKYEPMAEEILEKYSATR